MAKLSILNKLKGLFSKQARLENVLKGSFGDEVSNLQGLFGYAKSRSTDVSPKYLAQLQGTTVEQAKNSALAFTGSQVKRDLALTQEQSINQLLMGSVHTPPTAAPSKTFIEEHARLRAGWAKNPHAQTEGAILLPEGSQRGVLPATGQHETGHLFSEKSAEYFSTIRKAQQDPATSAHLKLVGEGLMKAGYEKGAVLDELGAESIRAFTSQKHYEIGKTLQSKRIIKENPDIRYSTMLGLGNEAMPGGIAYPEIEKTLAGVGEQIIAAMGGNLKKSLSTVEGALPSIKSLYSVDDLSRYLIPKSNTAHHQIGGLSEGAGARAMRSGEHSFTDGSDWMSPYAGPRATRNILADSMSGGNSLAPTDTSWVLPTKMMEHSWLQSSSIGAYAYNLAHKTAGKSGLDKSLSRAFSSAGVSTSVYNVGSVLNQVSNPLPVIDTSAKSFSTWGDISYPGRIEAFGHGGFGDQRLTNTGFGSGFQGGNRLMGIIAKDSGGIRSSLSNTVQNTVPSEISSPGYEYPVNIVKIQTVSPARKLVDQTMTNLMYKMVSRRANDSVRKQTMATATNQASASMFIAATTGARRHSDLRRS